MRLLLCSTGLTTGIGIVSAWLAEHLLSERIAILGSFVGLQLSHNPGIAFGIRLPAGGQEVLIVVALIIVFVVAVKQIRTAISYKLLAISFGLILGGGIANMIDRLPDGLVTDFIQVGSFPLFNIPDSCITVGVVLLLLESCVRKSGVHGI